MNAPARLAAFGVAALLSLAGGAAIGAAVGPIDDPDPAHPTHEEEPVLSTTAPTHRGTHTRTAATATAYRIDTATAVPTAGVPTELTFRVLAPTGEAVTRFEDRHERPMHLILVSADVTTYAHLHPTLAADGTWTVTLPGLDPGGYRLVADTVPVGGPDLVLTTELIVPGRASIRPVPEPATTVAVDGLQVDLGLTPSGGDLAAVLTVTRAGAPVLPDPYLGARGHLVAIALDDLAYLHVHPETESAPDAPGVRFLVADARSGRYRLFFDFAVDGIVRTAAFTVDITTGGATDPATSHTHTAADAHR